MIVILDDDEVYSHTLSLYIRKQIPECLNLNIFHDSNLAEKFISNNLKTLSLLVVDYRMPDVTGLQFIEKVVSPQQVFQIIILTGQLDSHLTYSLNRYNVFDLCEKSQPFPDIVTEIQKALEYGRHLRKRNEKFNSLTSTFVSLNPEYKNRTHLIFKSKAIEELERKIDKLKNTDSPCLITGESGTGKKLLATKIHEESLMLKGNYLVVDCSTLTPVKLDEILFDNQTGEDITSESKKPITSLILDDITEIPKATQVKLVNYLQQFYYDEKYKSTKSIKRIISCSKKKINEEVSSGKFREDLFYLLNIVQLDLPPLRERLEDLNPIFNYYLNYFSKKENKVVPVVDPEVTNLFMNYSWPGNIRELINLTYRLLVFCENSKINISDLPYDMLKNKNSILNTYSGDESFPLSKKELEKLSLVKALQSTNGNKDRAAEIIGISRASIYRKIKQYNIEVDIIR